jgi:hypothetical protein
MLSEAGVERGFGRRFATYLSERVGCSVGMQCRMQDAGCANGCPGTWRGTRYLALPRPHAAANCHAHSLAGENLCNSSYLALLPVRCQPPRKYLLSLPPFCTPISRRLMCPLHFPTVRQHPQHTGRRADAMEPHDHAHWAAAESLRLRSRIERRDFSWSTSPVRSGVHAS